MNDGITTPGKAAMVAARRIIGTAAAVAVLVAGYTVGHIDGSSEVPDPVVKTVTKVVTVHDVKVKYTRPPLKVIHTPAPKSCLRMANEIIKLEQYLWSADRNASDLRDLSSDAAMDHAMGSTVNQLNAMSAAASRINDEMATNLINLENSSAAYKTAKAQCLDRMD